MAVVQSGRIASRTQPAATPLASSLNRRVAAMLREASDILLVQRAGTFRVNAYRKAADVVAELPVDVGRIFLEGGHEALQDLPGVGRSLSRAIAEIATTGHWEFLERLRGQLDSVRLLSSVPGIGETFARQIHEKLRVDSLEDLERAAHDGRLRWLPGMGARRVAAIKASLASILGGRRARRAARRPSVAHLLLVDRHYRMRAESGSLPRIAPKRFNPSREAWLPILHEDVDGWHFTALYSNSARAHMLGKTHDWVVLYYESDENGTGQATVVTESSGPLKGRRVVRGRELECRAEYGG